ncbi:MAG: hypothetical protein RG741_07665 [Bacteroidales bacterium]|nr:hypothetical protein [Bacteroidales bacterium]
MKTLHKKETLFALKGLSVLVVMLLLSGSFFTLQAHSKEMRISPLRFAGVHSLGVQPGQSEAYMVLHSASAGNWNFHLLDKELNELMEGVVEAPRYSFFNEMTFDGEHILMSFVVNAFTPSITYVVLDALGNEVARTTRTDAPMLRRGDRFFPSVYGHPEGGFILVQATGGGRRAGYTVEYADHQLNTQWSLDFKGDKGTVHVYDMMLAGDRLYILEATERLGNTLNARLHCLSLSDAAHTYTMELTDNDYTYFPTAILPVENNRIALAGTYFSGDKIRQRSSGGLFFLFVEEDGGTAGMEVHPWRGLRPTLRTSVPDWFFKLMPEVYIHALEIMPDGSFTAVAELYRYSGEVRREERDGLKEQYHRIRMLDFMLINFNSNGSIAYTERIERPHMVLKLDSEFSSSGSLAENAGSGPLRRARAMKKAGAFTYRFHQMTDEGFKLAFMSYENKTHYAYLMDIQSKNSVKLDLRHAKPSIISYLQLIDLCANQSGFGFILTELNTRSFDDSEAFWRGLLPAGNNNMLTYEYRLLGGTLSLKLTEL